MVHYNEAIINLVKERLRVTPSNIKFSIEGYSDFTRDQLIEEIDKGSEIGNRVIGMQLQFIRSMPIILNQERDESEEC